MSFRIKSARKESENKTLRFPVRLIERINNAIMYKNTSFSSFVLQAGEYALDHLENYSDEQQDT